MYVMCIGVFVCICACVHMYVQCVSAHLYGYTQTYIHLYIWNCLQISLTNISWIVHTYLAYACSS